MAYGTAQLTWNRNVESDLAGYRVYYGTDGVVFPFSTDVGLTSTPSTPSVMMTNFVVFGTLYFAVTAYDTSNNESGRSNVVSKSIAPFLDPMGWPPIG